MFVSFTSACVSWVRKVMMAVLFSFFSISSFDKLRWFFDASFSPTRYLMCLVIFKSTLCICLVLCCLNPLSVNQWSCLMCPLLQFLLILFLFLIHFLPVLPKFISIYSTTDFFKSEGKMICYLFLSGKVSTDICTSIKVCIVMKTEWRLYRNVTLRCIVNRKWILSK